MKRMWLVASKFDLPFAGFDPQEVLEAVPDWDKLTLSLNGTSPVLYKAITREAFALPDYWTEGEAQQFARSRVMQASVVELADEDYDALISRIDNRSHTGPVAPFLDTGQLGR